MFKTPIITYIRPVKAVIRVMQIKNLIKEPKKFVEIKNLINGRQSSLFRNGVHNAETFRFGHIQTIKERFKPFAFRLDDAFAL